MNLYFAIKYINSKSSSLSMHIKVDVTNRTMFLITAVLALIIAGIIVYAVVPNPGHSASEIEGDILSDCEFVNSTDSSDDTHSVSCPGSKKAISGGGTCNSGGIRLRVSAPTGGVPPTGWVALCDATDTIDVYANCCTVS